jgi:hypothetical protein
VGHDSHFLSRLDRVTPEQCELALGLYRDEEVVKKLLDHAKLPEGVERVAISMDHPREGPFIIVARNGHFVTCLGRGMHVSQHPIVTRGELDKIATKVHTLRDQLKLAREVVPTEGELAKLMKRIGKAGHAMPQEDFEGLAVWAPMMWPKYLNGFLSVYEEVEKQKIDLLVNEGYKEPDEGLENYWKAVFGMGHLALLATLGDPDAWKDIAAFLIKAKTTFTRPLIDQRLMSFAMKALWIAGHIGEPLIESYEQALFAGEGKAQGYDAVLGLAGIAAVHEDLRPRITKIFDEGKKRWAEAENLDIRLRSELMVAAEQLYVMTELSAETIKFGNKMVFDAGSKLGKDSEFRFESADLVPPNIALAAIANTTVDWWDSVMPMFPLTLLPFASVLDAQDLYLPRGLASKVAIEWSREHTIELLARPGKGVARREPVRAPSRPGRNDPCSCGSGKKYKKCHGA